MNRSHGLTAGVLLLAGALARPLLTTTPPAAPATDASAPAAPGTDNADALVAGGKGPWSASCKYWAAARAANAPANAPGSIAIQLTTDGTNFQSHATGALQKSPPCPGSKDRWGLPTQEDQDISRPHITAMIAAVPDPLHEHLALDFDETIDGLVQAATDNGYVESYSWLPWRPLRETVSAADEETQEENLQQQEPGLIILKRFLPITPDEAKSGKEPDRAHQLDTNYYTVIYLFLVGSEPIEGINGRQLAKALQYEADLKQNPANVDFRLSFTPDKTNERHMSVIGPYTSGAAASWLEQLRRGAKKLAVTDVDIAAGTGTLSANSLLNSSSTDPKVSSVSFSGDAQFETKELYEHLNKAGFHIPRVAFLVEDGSAYGQGSLCTRDQRNCGEESDSYPRSIKAAPQAITIRFPRGISLLRNIREKESGQISTQTDLYPSPSLHASLEDRSREGSLPHFSSQTPASQETTLEAIARQMQRYRVQVIVIQAGSVLDAIFLSKGLHRAVPDARLITFSSDLLFTRDEENETFVGALSITPYNLVAPVASRPDDPFRLFSSGQTETTYNAASYAFWNLYSDRYPDAKPLLPALANYRDIFRFSRDDKNPNLYPSLWAMAIGRDGYSPVGMLSPCASSSEHVLPLLHNDSKTPLSCASVILNRLGPLPTDHTHFPVNPSLWWHGLCTLICLGCCLHVLCMLFAKFASPFTHDLEIAHNDEPRRRAVYIHIGSVMLFCMAFVTAYPLFPAMMLIAPHAPSKFLAVVTLTMGLAALIVSLWKTARYARPQQRPEKGFDEYVPVHVIAHCAMVVIPLLWASACYSSTRDPQESYVGVFFSYRCLNPMSGVSPLLPVLLLLLGWYVWSILQTRRLRFSEASRPRLPDILPGNTGLYVPDEDLTGQGGKKVQLYENITCLMIVTEVAKRFLPRVSSVAILTGVLSSFLGLLALAIVGIHVETMERLFFVGRWFMPTHYEFLVEVLLYSLLIMALTGLLRMVLVWGALRRGLLAPLEQLPLRTAFDRLQAVGWLTLMRQSDLYARHRGAARSLESLRQMAHDPRLEDIVMPVYQRITRLNSAGSNRAELRAFHPIPDTPDLEHRAELYKAYKTEKEYAGCATELLRHILVPFWNGKRRGLVEPSAQSATTLHARRADHEPAGDFALYVGPAEMPASYIELAEEFLALRYMALIRSVLVNIRHLASFTSAAFVLAMIAWNSYPFRPREWVDACFTTLFVLLAVVTVWVFAQMYRDSLLSRITNTKANELGVDFYLRILTFGALPVLTWMAYEFPTVGATILKYLQPSLEVVK